MKIFTPIVEQLKLQIRFNLSARKVEIRVRLLLFMTYLTNVLLLEVLSLISDETSLLCENGILLNESSRSNEEWSKCGISCCRLQKTLRISVPFRKQQISFKLFYLDLKLRWVYFLIVCTERHYFRDHWDKMLALFYGEYGYWLLVVWWWLLPC